MTTLTRKELIQCYLSANSAGSYTRGNVAKDITVFNKANKTDPITTASVLKEYYPSFYNYLSKEGTLKDKEVLENNFRKRLGNLNCLTRVVATSSRKNHYETICSRALFSEVYAHSNKMFYSPLYSSLTFKLEFKTYYNQLVCTQNPRLIFSVQDAIHLLREV